jgi:DNA-binding NtrC family response regulator
MEELIDFMKQYDFKCKKCSFKPDEFQFIGTVRALGIIILIGEIDGYIGWSCPACDDHPTNLTRVEGDPYEFIALLTGHSSARIYSNLMYRSFPFNFVEPNNDLSNSGFALIEHSFDKLSARSFSRRILPKNGKYITYKFETYATGPAILFSQYELSKIETLIAIENEKHIKAFPRYSQYNWLLNAIDILCWNNRVQFEFYRVALKVDLRKNLNFNLNKNLNMQTYSFLSILDSVNSITTFNCGLIETDSSDCRYRDWNDRFSKMNKNYYVIRKNSIGGLKKIEYCQYSDFGTKAWSDFNSDWMQELLNDLGDNFITEYLYLTKKSACNYDLLLPMIGSYINKLYNAITSKYKRKTIRREANINSLKCIEEVEKCFSGVKIISNDKNINFIKTKISQIAPLKQADSFLILGERGTGKDLFARAIHEASKQIGQLVKIDCGAISERLFESELFGYKKGAFTGALQDTIGKFGYAMGGTLFFDEIGNLPLNLQPKLLRALQDRQYVPVGSGEVKKIDAKFIFATNKDLNKMVEEGSFMPDLYDRFKRPQITIPPLREIKNDVILLANYFIDHNDTHRQDNKELQPIRLSKDCVEILKAFNWPGNIRELQQVIKEIVLMRQASGDRSEISESELPDDITQTKRKTPSSHSKGKNKLPGNTKIKDEELIHWMKEHGNNKTRVAEQLGVTYKTIWERCKRIEL